MKKGLGQIDAKLKPHNHQEDHDKIIGVALLASIEFRHAIEALWQHFSDCHSSMDILMRVFRMDEATFAGVIAFALILYLLLKEPVRAIADRLARRSTPGSPKKPRIPRLEV